MALEQVVPGLYQLPLGIVNAFILISSKPGGGEELALIDTGPPGSERTILAAIAELGRSPQDLRHIILTHGHYDHAGSAAALVAATGADLAMHPTDAALFAQGKGLRETFRPGPGLLNWLLFRMVAVGGSSRVTPAPVDHLIEHGQILPLAGGLEVIHAPGHCAGQVALLWRRYRGVLIAADVAGNIGGLRYSVGYEDIEAGRRTLAHLGTLNFNTAVFGHGKPILNEANRRFQAKWPAEE